MVALEAMVRGEVWHVVCTGVVSSPVFLLSLSEVRWVCMMYLCSCLCLVLEWCLLVSMYEG